MFDFRYHALSLVAVFLALAIGLLLGVAIGDRGLVSGAERDLRRSLRSDVRTAQSEAADARADAAEQRDARERFERAIYPYAVGGRLADRRIGLLALGGVGDDVVGDVKDALDDTGGKLASVAVVRGPLALDELAKRAGRRYASLGDAGPGLIERFGERVGIQYTQGGKLLGRVRRTLLDPFSGALGGVEGVVLVRRPGTLEGDAAKAYDAFERGLVRGLGRNDVPVIGVQRSDAKQSQVSWFEDHGLTSVDDIDAAAGQAALVYALDGAQGTFGIGPRADALIPRAASR